MGEVEHWARGGATRLSRLVPPCRRHHRHVHEGCAIVFTDALGRRIEEAPRTTGSTQAIVAGHACEGTAIDPLTATARWRGERLDLDRTVAVLCSLGPLAGVSATAPTS